MPRRQFMQIAVAFEGVILVVAVALGWLADQRFWADIKVTWAAVALAIAFTLPLVAGVIAIAESKSPLFDQIREDFDTVIKLFKGCTIADVALLSTIAGLGEEALFRGVIQNFLSGFLHPAIAIAVASAIFGACHFISPGYAVSAAAIGALLGTIYIWTGNLLTPMLIHGLYDFALLVYALTIVLPRNGGGLTTKTAENEHECSRNE